MEAGETDFPAQDFFKRNQSQLSDAEWRLFAADCAEHVLHYYEADYPNDDRPRTAIAVARRFAKGEATVQELYDARHAVAAHSAAAAARSAAWSATAWAARSAAWSAVWSAAQAAAWSAARSAAESAAWSAAESAARSAAASATRQAEIAWQAARLSDYLLGLSALPPPVSNE